MIVHFKSQINNYSNKYDKILTTSLGGIIVPGEVALYTFIRSESGTENNLKIYNKLTRLSIDELKHYYSEHYSFIYSVQEPEYNIPVITKKPD